MMGEEDEIWFATAKAMHGRASEDEKRRIEKAVGRRHLLIVLWEQFTKPLDKASVKAIENIQANVTSVGIKL